MAHHTTGACAQNTHAPTTTTPADEPSRPLLVLLYPWHRGACEYRGTRAQLEAEGVLPAGLQWPQGGDLAQWERNGLRYNLHRKRPADLKGPMRLWLEGDYWSLRWERANPPNWAECDIAAKRAELQQAIYRQSPQGMQAARARWQRLRLAKDDAAFQRLLARFAIPRKPGRPAKPATTPTKGAAA